MRSILKDFVVAAVLFVFVASSSLSASADWRKETKLMGEVFQLIENEYVYPIDLAKCRYDILKKLSRHSTVVVGAEDKKAADDFVKNEFVCLDRFSGFSDPDEARMMNDDLAGHFGGVGIQIGPQDGKVVVVAPIEGSPASKAGIQTGDFIVAVRQDGEKEAAPVKDLADAVKRMRGVPDTKVFVTIERAGKTFEVELVRSDIKTSAVSKKDLPGGVGYVRLTEYTSTMADDLDLALATFRGNGPHPQVVLDLRGNPGGELAAALELLYMLSDDPKNVMLTVKTRKSEERYTIASPGYRFRDAETQKVRTPGKYKDYRFIVLIDGGSASASEVTTGTMKDWGYTVIADKNGACKSFGKGVGQSVHQLSDGSIFRITSFEFFDGNGKVKIHEIGVSGNECVEDSRANVSDKDDKGNTLSPQALALKKAAAIRENTATDKDAMVARALEIFKDKK